MACMADQTACLPFDKLNRLSLFILTATNVFFKLHVLFKSYLPSDIM